LKPLISPLKDCSAKVGELGLLMLRRLF
jgi:hypothetical protein